MKKCKCGCVVHHDERHWCECCKNEDGFVDSDDIVLLTDTGVHDPEGTGDQIDSGYIDYKPLGEPLY